MLVCRLQYERQQLDVAIVHSPLILLYYISTNSEIFIISAKKLDAEFTYFHGFLSKIRN
jgi:hypothetical protein